MDELAELRKENARLRKKLAEYKSQISEFILLLSDMEDRIQAIQPEPTTDQLHPWQLN